MTTGQGWAAVLLTGAAAGALPAQEVPDTPRPAAPPRMEFRGPDGKPLPPEVQRQLQERFAKNPPPELVRRGAPGDIVVTGERPRGSVTGTIPPERSFTQLDLRAYGADNVGALLDALAPQVASNRGRGDGAPVTLLNGRRVSDFSEIARIPSEAIERMEIFPEELALQYGYRADQKVVNIVTFPNFRSRVGQGTLLAPSDGGRETVIGNADYLSLRGDTRIGLGATYSHAASLLEAQRDLRQPAGSGDLGRFRTLLPETEQVALNALVSGHVLGDVSATLNGRFEANRSESLLGRDGDDPLRRDGQRDVAHLGTTLGGRSGRWQWTATGNYDRISNDVRTDLPGAASRRDRARSVDALANATLLLSGPLADLPAGPLSASLRGGIDLRDFTARSTRDGVAGPSDLSRDQGAVQLNLDLPLLGRAGEKPSPVGTLSINANAALERLSDAGTLRTYGYGLVWSPIDAVGVVASATAEEAAPTLEQLGGPLLVTPNVRTFDLGRRDVVDITRVSGGNPALRSDDRHVVRLGLNVRPIARTDLTVSVDYVATRVDDPIAAFPLLTPAIEAAFPDRFARDAAGRLTRIDGRALNFAESRQEQLRWGVNFTRPLGPVPAGMQNAPMRVFTSEADARRAHPGAVFTRAEPGSAASQRAANLTSRLFFSLYHNWYLRDAVVLRDGLPTLDLLNGGAVDGRGGRRRHEIEAQAGAFKRGLGARIAANWQSGTTIDGSGAGDLRFADYATVNLSLFANLAERFGGSAAPGWLKGTRASIGVTNLFDTRPSVRDRAGEVPIAYQPAYLDPLGRTFSLNLRKRF